MSSPKSKPFYWWSTYSRGESVRIFDPFVFREKFVIKTGRFVGTRLRPAHPISQWSTPSPTGGSLPRRHIPRRFLSFPPGIPHSLFHEVGPTSSAADLSGSRGYLPRGLAPLRWKPPYSIDLENARISSRTPILNGLEKASSW